LKRRKKTRNTDIVFPLKRLLARKKLSQRSLARSAGMDYNRVNDLANGRHLPNWDTVVRIAQAINADLGDFQPGPEDKPARKPAKRRPRAKVSTGKQAGELQEV
jgi:transcriptional regulator with XRE-family HTH domain